VSFVGDHLYPHLKGKKALARFDTRRGRVFTLRLTPEDEQHFRNLMADVRDIMPWRPYGRKDALGPFILWLAKRFNEQSERARLAEPPGARVIPEPRAGDRAGNTRAPGGRDRRGRQADPSDRALQLTRRELRAAKKAGLR
jgi:hypothetical protein